MKAYALEIQDLCKSFGPTKIINQLNLSVKTGERVAIIGPNGAGKSTLFSLISGQFAPSSGAILLNGLPIHGKPPHEINRLGLARSFQITNVFPNLSVFENLCCSVLWNLGHGYQALKRLSGLKDVNDRANRMMNSLKLADKCDKLASELTYAEMRALELGVTLGSGSEIILLDEPTAGMNNTETGQFLQLILEVTQGKTLLAVEHDMSVVFGLADKIAVLVYGELIAYDTPEAIKTDPAVRQAYLGVDL
jgi:branched-chain amino acid transport system ATP-binding protein